MGFDVKSSLLWYHDFFNLFAFGMSYVRDCIEVLSVGFVTNF